MAEPWSEVGRWSWTFVRSWLPQRLLRWGWKDQQILNGVHAAHYEQSPRFYCTPGHQPPQLDIVGFNLYNQTPFNLSIVGADIGISVNSREWIRHRERLPQECPVPAYGRGGYNVRPTLSEWQVTQLREHLYDWMHIRIAGYLVLKSSFGELRKEIHSDVAAIIDRDEHVRVRQPT